MEYSISSLTKKARITARTLRHYDQIGLLKPSIRMANGRRVYNDEEYMRLCEIVFFKKVGISLTKIKEIFRAKDVAQAVANALVVRKQTLAKEMEKLQRHLMTIDIVLPQYKNCKMTQKERLEKFCSYQKMVKEVEAIEIQEVGKGAVEKAKKKIEALSEEEVDALTDRSNELMKGYVKAVEQGLAPGSKEVQELIQQNFDIMAEYHALTHEIYVKLRDSILDQRKFYAAYHPHLPEFLYEAMDVFAEKLRGKK